MLPFSVVRGKPPRLYPCYLPDVATRRTIPSPSAPGDGGEVEARLRRARKVELHQHVDGSIPLEVTWELMRHYRLSPADSLQDMRRHLEIQEGEEGSLLAYLDKMHYPLWVTQFYENISQVTEAIALAAAGDGVQTLELRYAPLIHTYAGLTPRQSIRAALSGLNHARRRHPGMKLGLIVIAMRQHGPHIAKILARQALAEAQHLHERAGVVGFDIAGPERGNPPRLFRSAYEVARLGRLGLTAHAGEDGPAEYVWQAVDELGVDRVGHGCAAARDRALLKRLAKDAITVEVCLSSNYHTGAVRRGERHPVHAFLEAGVPVALCCDNSTVSRTGALTESRLAAAELGVDAVELIHRQAEARTFIRPETALTSRDGD
jgi:adenosine deaminase